MKLAEIEACLQRTNRTETQLLALLDKARSNLTIKCNCGGYHKIRALKIIQHYYYTEPYGCSGGDFWSESNISFLCPKDETYSQKMLFDKHDVEYGFRNHFDHNPEMQFKRFYKYLFKEIIDGTDDEYKHLSFVNSYYVDENRKKFGLVEKVEKK